MTNNRDVDNDVRHCLVLHFQQPRFNNYWLLGALLFFITPLRQHKHNTIIYSRK